MNQLLNSITVLLSAVIGVAILSVLVSHNNNTVGVIGAAAHGFEDILGTAMNGGSGGGGGMGFFSSSGASSMPAPAQLGSMPSGPTSYNSGGGYSSDLAMAGEAAGMAMMFM